MRNKMVLRMFGCIFIFILFMGAWCDVCGYKGIPSMDKEIFTTTISRSAKAPAGWSDDIRVTYCTRVSSPAIAVNGNFVHVVWRGPYGPVENPDSYEIYYNRSMDGGRTWENGKMLSEYVWITGGNFPKIAVSGSNIHVVYQSINGTDEIYYLNSTDNGETWSIPQPISIVDSSNDKLPDIAVSGDNIHVVWDHEYTLGQFQVCYRNSTDGGNTWNPIQVIENSNADQGNAQIAVNDSNIHVVWTAWVGNWETYYKNSTNGGDTWGSDIPLSSIDGFNSDAARIAVNGNNVHVVWQDNMGYSADEIHYRNSTDNGDTWNDEMNITLNDGIYSSQPTIAVNGSDIHVVWIDKRDNYGYNGANEIYYKNSADGGMTWGTEARLTTALNNSLQPDIISTDGYVHVVWMDNRTGDTTHYEIYYKRSPDFDNETFTFDLDSGWNLITLPLNNTTYQRAEDLAQAIPNCTYIGRWNSTTQTVDMHLKGTNENNFTVDNGTGYFVYVNSSSVFTIYGGVVNSSDAALIGGWNSLGWYNFTATDAENIGTKIVNCIAVAYWDNALSRFISHPVGTNISNFTIERGVGYFVYIA